MAQYHDIVARGEKHRDTEDPRLANQLALDLALVAVDAAGDAARMELDRRDLLNGIRQRIMDERKLAKTPAEEEAKTTAQYKEHLEATQALTEVAEKAKALSRYFAAITFLETTAA